MGHGEQLAGGRQLRSGREGRFCIWELEVSDLQLDSSRALAKSLSPSYLSFLMGIKRISFVDLCLGRCWGASDISKMYVTLTFLIKNYLVGTYIYPGRWVWDPEVKDYYHLLGLEDVVVSRLRASGGKKDSAFSSYSPLSWTNLGEKARSIMSRPDGDLCFLLSLNRLHVGRNWKVTQPRPKELWSHITAVTMMVLHHISSLTKPSFRLHPIHPHKTFQARHYDLHEAQAQRH